MPDLLTRETARTFQVRHMAEYKTTEQIILLAQAVALEWAADRLATSGCYRIGYEFRHEAARLRKEAENG